jgi:hypothetical protein
MAKINPAAKSDGEAYTRSTGAKSGVESYFIAWALVLLLVPRYGFSTVALLVALMFAAQLYLMQQPDVNIMWYMCLSQKLGPSVMRNASIGFAECVRPGGKPTVDHCLNLYNISPVVTAIGAGLTVCAVLAVGPVLALVRILYREHWEGVPKSKLKLWWYFVRHPIAIQGEGPSNGDGLAAMNASESSIYPITPKELEQGPMDRDYWLGEEPRPRLRDMFHDKLFCARFFKSHGVPHPKMVCEVFESKRRHILYPIEEAPKELIWKPRYSTMGLGVEHFTGWDKVDKPDWAPSSVPYVVEEYIKSTEVETSEWYRMTTLWDFDEASPKPGYCWQTRNAKGDKRVQTDILGGPGLDHGVCCTSKHKPWVCHNKPGTFKNPRTGEVRPLDKKTDAALSRAIDLQIKMHKNLGKELHSIGWDVMVRGDEPVFIEFNINNGFFVGDHTLEEVEQMTAFYGKNYNARLPGQLLNFDPYAEPKEQKKKR